MSDQISVTMVSDSVSPFGVRLMSMECVNHRFIHSEFMTHRVFSRNASSSRAIPSKQLIERVRTDPMMPVEWGMNKPGMQAGEMLSTEDQQVAEFEWRLAAKHAANQAERLLALKAHKQIVNRVLEPFLPIKVLVTATEWEGFFDLRDHEDAQPEIRELARHMKAAIANSKPVHRHDSWHLPYISDEERALSSSGLTEQQLLAISVARCARVSYRLHDGKPTTLEADLKLYEDLVGSDPRHASPTEHQAFPIGSNTFKMPLLEMQRLNSNLIGWVQYRKMLELEWYGPKQEEI